MKMKTAAPITHKDRNGNEIKVGDMVAYSGTGSTRVHLGRVLKLTAVKVTVQGQGSKTPRNLLNISNQPVLIPDIMKHYVAPFRHLDDDQIQNLIKMFESTDAESVQLARDLMETYKNQLKDE